MGNWWFWSHLRLEIRGWMSSKFLAALEVRWVGRVDRFPVISKKSPTGPTERTPKPENLIALATSLGVRW